LAGRGREGRAGHGKAGVARLGKAGPGKARLGMARQAMQNKRGKHGLCMETKTRLGGRIWVRKKQ